ncbi:glycosyl hydrolase [Ktedonosporobacter rubrisoli]|uniref:Glycosyl hydrolase n=1 Tax=Ktedonosporobacter rubrisoli TaxID=2509675 RepID=A0A4P6JP03_KTERU|nr:glycosyl hydrolase [Ktedonosporobacter rubrisoli]QBD77068.1 glycosyl hydrolase [Ktedonosporobacter rubrisoli]
MAFYIAMSQELLVARKQEGAWQVASRLTGLQITSVAADPFHPQRIYCGTYGRGLWRSTDGGEDWQPIGDTPMVPAPFRKQGITEANIIAVAVSTVERIGEYGVIYVGTEPGTLFRSEDGGESWQELTGMRELPSSSTWSFPPKPATNHVCCITPDPVEAGRVFVAIEAGALVYTTDGGKTWIDRVPEGPFDTHTLVMHPDVPGRLYSAAGDGFAEAGKGYNESYDGGQTWQHPDEGLEHQYLRSVAVDPADPDTIIVSASESPQKGHYPFQPESFIYRKTRGQPWQMMTKGLPERGEMILPVLATHSAEPGVFYALNNRGLYRSPDAGQSWQRVELPWSERLAHQSPMALVITKA